MTRRSAGLGGAPATGAVDRAVRDLCTGELGDGLLRAGVVDQALAVSGCGHQRGRGGVVEGAGQPVGVAVEPGGGIVSYERVGPAGERQMVPEVADGLGEVHAAEAETDAYALVQGGEHALAQPRCQGGLAEQDPRERRRGVKLGVCELSRTRPNIKLCRRQDYAEEAGPGAA